MGEMKDAFAGLSKKFFLVVVVVVAVQFLSGVVPLAVVAGFIPFLLLLVALRLSTCLVSGHPPFSNQSSLSLSLVSSRSSSVVLAFSCHSLQDPAQPSLSSSLLSTCSYHLQGGQKVR